MMIYIVFCNLYNTNQNSSNCNSEQYLQDFIYCRHLFALHYHILLEHIKYKQGQKDIEWRTQPVNNRTIKRIILFLYFFLYQQRQNEPEQQARKNGYRNQYQVP